jgi:serine/threonine protein kinase
MLLPQSDPSKPISFVTKLSDFGLAKLLRENYYIVNRSGSGTVTHLAPELFQVRSMPQLLLAVRLATADFNGPVCLNEVTPDCIV